MTKKRRPLPDHMRHKIAKQYPEHAELVGLPRKHRASPPLPGLREAGTVNARPAKPKREKAVRDGATFDSHTEARVFDLLKARAVAVLRQFTLVVTEGHRWSDGAKASSVTLTVDFLVVEEVLPDGRFIGRLVDAKAKRPVKDNDGQHRGKTQTHVEPDFHVKARIVPCLFGGLRVFIATPEDAGAEKSESDSD